MAIDTTVNVEFNTTTQVVTLTGGNTEKKDGTVNADWGPGNLITFVPTGTNTAEWELTNISWTPTEPAALTWAWKDGKANTSIVVTDDDEIPAGRAEVDYAYSVYARNKRTGQTVRTDPSIINKPAPSMTRRMGGAG